MADLIGLLDSGLERQRKKETIARLPPFFDCHPMSSPFRSASPLTRCPAAISPLLLELAVSCARCEPVDSSFCRCLAAPPRARCLLHSVRARGFIVLPLSIRYLSGSHQFAKGLSPLVHRLILAKRHFLGLALICDRPEPVGPSPDPRQSALSRARSWSIGYPRAGAGAPSRAPADRTGDNRLSYRRKLTRPRPTKATDGYSLILASSAGGR